MFQNFSIFVIFVNLDKDAELKDLNLSELSNKLVNWAFFIGWFQ